LGLVLPLQLVALLLDLTSNVVAMIIGGIVLLVVLGVVYSALGSVGGTIALVLLGAAAIGAKMLYEQWALKNLDRIVKRIKNDPKSPYAVKQMYKRAGWVRWRTGVGRGQTGAVMAERYWQRGDVEQLVRVDARRGITTRSLLLVVMDDPIPRDPGFSRIALVLVLRRLICPRRRIYVLDFEGGSGVADRAAQAASGVLGVPVKQGKFGMLSLSIVGDTALSSPAPPLPQAPTSGAGSAAASPFGSATPPPVPQPASQTPRPSPTAQSGCVPAAIIGLTVIVVGLVVALFALITWDTPSRNVASGYAEPPPPEQWCEQMREVMAGRRFSDLESLLWIDPCVYWGRNQVTGEALICEYKLFKGELDSLFEPWERVEPYPDPPKCTTAGPLTLVRWRMGRAFTPDGTLDCEGIEVLVNCDGRWRSAASVGGDWAMNGGHRFDPNNALHRDIQATVDQNNATCLEHDAAMLRETFHPTFRAIYPNPADPQQVVANDSAQMAEDVEAAWADQFTFSYEIRHLKVHDPLAVALGELTQSFGGGPPDTSGMLIVFLRSGNRWQYALSVAGDWEEVLME
jgi:hypothetical protein